MKGISIIHAMPRGEGGGGGVNKHSRYIGYVQDGSLEKDHLLSKNRLIHIMIY